MPIQKITQKMRRGEANTPSNIRIDILDLLHVGRRIEGYGLPPMKHGASKYKRHSKHKGRCVDV